MAEVTNVELTLIKERLKSLEAKIEGNDEQIRIFYRDEWGRLDRLSTNLDNLIATFREDRQEHRELESRVLKCETHIMQLRSDLLQLIGNMEKKFLRLVALAGLISGGAGASVLKLFNLALGV